MCVLDQKCLVGLGVSSEWEAPCQHFEENDAETVDIRAVPAIFGG
jgi:hypothetical protein